MPAGLHSDLRNFHVVAIMERQIANETVRVLMKLATCL